LSELVEVSSFTEAEVSDKSSIKSGLACSATKELQVEVSSAKAKAKFQFKLSSISNAIIFFIFCVFVLIS
jgi:hypothetical protein